MFRLLNVNRIQKLTGTHKELRGLAQKVKVHFQQALKDNKGNLQEFQEQFLNALKHWTGKHDSKYCKHTIDTTKTPRLINAAAIEALTAVMTEFSEEAKHCIN